MGGKNTGNKDAQSKKSWQASNNVPDNQSNQRTQLDRLTAKYGEGFKDTTQGKGLQAYLDGVSVNRGGNMGADKTSFYTTGNDKADNYRYNSLSGDLDVSDIKGINTALARKGLSSEDYFKYNQFLREGNPNAYDKARPINSGKLISTLGSSFFPGGGIIKLLQKAKNTGVNKVKDLTDKVRTTNTIDDGNKEETVSLDIESIKNDKKIKKNNFINTDNLSEEQKLELWNKAQTAGEIVNNSTVNQIVSDLPYQYQANQNDFDALRANRSLDFSQLAGAPNKGENTSGISGVNLDNMAYKNYLANKAGYPNTGINNTSMIEAMKTNPTLLNRASPTGLNYNALGEVSTPQDSDASLGYDFLNNRIV